MNFLISLACCLASINASGLSFLDANVPDLDHGVDVAVTNVSFDQATGIFTYNYRFGNPSANSGGLSSLQMDISQPVGGVVFSSAALGPDVRFSRRAANRMLDSSEVNIVPIAVKSPLNWFGGIGLGNIMDWASIDQAFDIAPSSSLAGFVIRSHAPPGTRSFVAEPFLDEDKLPDDQFNLDVAGDIAGPNTFALMEQLKVKGTTLGPTPPPSLEPNSLIDNLISLKHQSVSLGWLRGDGFIKDLDEKLDQAKRAFAKNHPSQARKKLGEFIDKLEEQRKEQLERQQEASEEGREERADHFKDDMKFLSGNAFFLLKSNAEFIISKLPGKPEDDDREDDRR